MKPDFGETSNNSRKGGETNGNLSWNHDPFLGNNIGRGLRVLYEKIPWDLVQRSLAGFAAGVMVAASIWSLLIPAIEQSEGTGKLSFLPAFIGFWVGVLFLLLLDHLIPHLHVGSNQAEGPKSRLGRSTMMVLAVTLHNIPEGMAVGVVYAGFLAGNAQITAASALVLSLGIAIQNFPEGAIISINHISWWAQELPSDEEYAEARRNLDAVGWQVDYIITHCAPTSIVLMGSRHNEADWLTDFLQEVQERAKYHYWLFGHYHDNRAIDEKHILLWEQIVRII